MIAVSEDNLSVVLHAPGDLRFEQVRSSRADYIRH